jgi:hypothetical protein
VEPRLLIPTEGELRYIESTMLVSGINPADFPGWQDRLGEIGPLLLNAIRVERQTQNDCQGNSLATGEESRKFLLTGEMVQLARTYAYNASEYLSGRSNIGRDQGTSIQSGVRLLTEGLKALNVSPGLPTEAAYEYGTYERSAGRFEARAKAAVIDRTYVSEHGESPPLDELPVACAAGGGIHFGCYWGVKFTTKKVGDRTFKVWGSTPGSGGGHALEIVTCLKIDGAWWPLVWNSHGDGPILMPPATYEYYQQRQFRPFGGYLLMPDKAKQRYENRRQTGGGYWFNDGSKLA